MWLARCQRVPRGIYGSLRLFGARNTPGSLFRLSGSLDVSGALARKWLAPTLRTSRPDFGSLTHFGSLATARLAFALDRLLAPAVWRSLLTWPACTTRCSGKSARSQIMVPSGNVARSSDAILAGISARSHNSVLSLDSARSSSLGPLRTVGSLSINGALWELGSLFQHGAHGRDGSPPLLRCSHVSRLARCPKQVRLARRSCARDPDARWDTGRAARS